MRTAALLAMHTVGWWIPCVQGIVAFSPSAASAVSVVSAASTNLQPAGVSLEAAHPPSTEQLKTSIQTTQYGCSVPSYTKVPSFSIRNDLDVAVLISWANFSCFEIPYQVINPHSVSIQPSFLDYIWIARISSNDNNGNGNILSSFSSKLDLDPIWTIKAQGSSSSTSPTTPSRTTLESGAVGSTTDAASHSRISDKAPPGVHDDSGDISGWHPGARLSGKMLILMLSLVGVAVIVALCGVMYMRGRWIAAHNANIMSRRSQIEAKKLPTIIYASMPFMGMQSASNQSIMGKQKQTQTQKRSSSLHGPLALLTGDCSMQSTLSDQSAENDIPSPTPMLDGVMGDLSSVRMSFLSVVLAAPSKAAMNEQTQSHELDPERGLPYGNYDNPIIGIPPVPNSVHVVLHPHISQEEDELDIVPGDRVLIQKVYSDEWALVYNTCGIEGVVPCYCFEA
ncbi:hypothetical protein BASA61_003071 [Batrachochytrium salamandrivorans]|nr:hypothetical protein BASA61_003071 [Batrachochytrium salamandrivorans]